MNKPPQGLVAAMRFIDVPPGLEKPSSCLVDMINVLSRLTAKTLAEP